MNRNSVTMAAAVLVLAALLIWFFSSGSQPPATPAAPRSPSSAAAPPTPRGPGAPRADLPPPPPPAEGCGGLRYASAAAVNAVTLHAMTWAPFRRPETGWATYAPYIGREISTRCGPTDPGFAEALSRWQAAQKRPSTGILAAEDFEVMRVTSHRRRPFVIAFAQGCPAAAEPGALAPARPDEGYAGKAVSLRRDVLDAYRRMRAAAQREVPAVAADPRLLTIISGYRSPAEAEARCVGRDCSGGARALCSAHRTGTALDLHVGGAPASTEDANRLAQSRNPAYRWLVANGERFGFVPYVFEPWHWEWAGADLSSPPAKGAGAAADEGLRAEQAAQRP